MLMVEVAEFPVLMEDGLNRWALTLNLVWAAVVASSSKSFPRSREHQAQPGG